MDLSDYEDLTGTTVSDTALYTAKIGRVQSQLEALLGYPLSAPGENLYNELGKTNNEFSCPSVVDEDQLEEPDEEDEETVYRLYDYQETEPYFHIDPFTQVNKVKIVYIRSGDSPNGITLKTFDQGDVRIHQTVDEWSKYLNIWPFRDWFREWFSWDGCADRIQIAVAADWAFSDVPDGLKYLWADMVAYEAYTASNDVKSESILTHSYTKADKSDPSTINVNRAILNRYAGPRGSVIRHIL